MLEPRRKPPSYAVQRNGHPLCPRELLAVLLEEHKLKQADLADIVPQSNLSAILAGRRPIGAALAIRLGQRFQVRPDLFFFDYTGATPKPQPVRAG
jgi:plasmid maintenance system antidote protein VapI